MLLQVLPFAAVVSCMLGFWHKQNTMHVAKPRVLSERFSTENTLSQKKHTTLMMTISSNLNQF